MLCGYGIFWYTLNCYFLKIQTNYPLIKGTLTPKKFIKATFKYTNNEKSLTHRTCLWNMVKSYGCSQGITFI